MEARKIIRGQNQGMRLKRKAILRPAALTGPVPASGGLEVLLGHKEGQNKQTNIAIPTL